MKTPPTSNNNKRGRHTIDEEWPEIVSTAKIGECQKIKIEVLAKKPKREIDIRNMSAEDLQFIQKHDPFLYYSIPGVRSAKLLMKDIDLSNLGDSGTSSRDFISSPSRLETMQAIDVSRSQKVSRSSCISFECHPDLLLGDLLDDNEEVSGSSCISFECHPDLLLADLLNDDAEDLHVNKISI